MYDLFVQNGVATKQGSVISRVDTSTGGHIASALPTNESRCALLANLLTCEGKPNTQVIEIKCEHRTGELDPVTCLRRALQQRYESKGAIVALGGAMLMERGRVRVHVMPDFSGEPLNTDDDVNKWLKFYEVGGPFCAVGTLVSGDADRQLDLRPQHFHGASAAPPRNSAGHYHHDVSPGEVRYRLVLVPAHTLVRVDRPPVTHLVGRD